jgi:hypothetical protein
MGTFLAWACKIYITKKKRKKEKGNGRIRKGR